MDLTINLLTNMADKKPHKNTVLKLDKSFAHVFRKVLGLVQITIM